MSQVSSDYYEAFPCPDCESEHMIQHITQSEDVFVDSDGNPDYIDPRDTVEVQEVWCPECDEKVWSRDS